MGGARRPARQGWWHLRHGGGREMVRNQQVRGRPADRLTGSGEGRGIKDSSEFFVSSSWVHGRAVDRDQGGAGLEQESKFNTGCRLRRTLDTQVELSAGSGI